ncbi:MAG: hydrogenase iron-sulfur subunit [Deltaproteobacteria bacterium]|jgi:coenzyme F420-reducing hydrogenase delta subunit|nr:hydrogenase iron-sulfur subunit [Deltaproteobacteria bacterium]
MSNRITAFCCNYTLSASEAALKKEGLIPEGVTLRPLPCTGRLEIKDLLNAFVEGAEAVVVVGCEKDACHNLKGSVRAEKRVKHVKGMLKELGMSPDLIEMHFAPRKASEPLIRAVEEMSQRLKG